MVVYSGSNTDYKSSEPHKTLYVMLRHPIYAPQKRQISSHLSIINTNRELVCGALANCASLLPLMTLLHTLAMFHHLAYFYAHNDFSASLGSLRGHHPFSAIWHNIVFSTVVCTRLRTVNKRT